MPFTLKRGDPFTIQILVTEPDFYISINGRHFASFDHRLPYGRISTLQVIGDVSDVEVEQMPVQEYPDKNFRSSENAVKSMDRFNEGDFTNGQYLVRHSAAFTLHLILPSEVHVGPCSNPI